MKGKGFHLLEYMKGYGNLSFQAAKQDQGLKDTSYGCLYLKDSAFTAVKRDATF